MKDEKKLLRKQSGGRSVYGKQERERLLRAYDESGLSMREFSQGHGIKYSTFRGWLWTPRGRGKKKPRPSISFAQVKLDGFAGS